MSISIYNMLYIDIRRLDVPGTFAVLADSR